jgi:hypothetical protein
MNAAAIFLYSLIVNRPITGTRTFAVQSNGIAFRAHFRTIPLVEYHTTPRGTLLVRFAPGVLPVGYSDARYRARNVFYDVPFSVARKALLS